MNQRVITLDSLDSSWVKGFLGAKSLMAVWHGVNRGQSRTQSHKAGSKLRGSDAQPVILSACSPGFNFWSLDRQGQEYPKGLWRVQSPSWFVTPRLCDRSVSRCCCYDFVANQWFHHITFTLTTLETIHYTYYISLRCGQSPNSSQQFVIIYLVQVITRWRDLDSSFISYTSTLQTKQPLTFRHL